MKSLIPLLFLSFFVAITADAQIRIAKPAGEKISIQLAGLQAGQDEASRVFMQTLQGNLNRSGWFVVRSGQAEVSVTGSLEVRGTQLRLQCAVQGTANRQVYLNKRYDHTAADARRLAHRVADDIVEAVTGRKGIASTRILSVGVVGNSKELFLMDADGGDRRQLTQDRSIALFPRWGPDGTQFTYTSYLQRFPDVYLVDLDRGGQRSVIANYSGLNAGGVLSPDGRDLAVILSRDGNPELYIKNLRSGRLTRLTQTLQANEASPSWSPDGSRIVYVSDQAGRPQLYVISRDGGAPRRLTSRGSENVAPNWGANNLIAFSSRIGGRYQIAYMNPDTQQTVYLEQNDGADYEEPSWAPNGRHIVCARRMNFRSAIYVLDTMGDAPIRLTPESGGWYSPAWSPQ